MVRINIINPKYLSDQHLIAEYVEILMLIGHTKKHPQIKNIPRHYCLGKGHITFFKNKLLYLKKRHARLCQEMKKRGFQATKTVSLVGLPRSLQKDWRPKKQDKQLIKARLISKLKKKPRYYRYYGKKSSATSLISLIKKS